MGCTLSPLDSVSIAFQPEPAVYSGTTSSEDISPDFPPTAFRDTMKPLLISPDPGVVGCCEWGRGCSWASGIAVSATQNRPQIKSTPKMLPRTHPDRIHVAFDDHRLVANAELILPATLALYLGLP